MKRLLRVILSTSIVIATACPAQAGFVLDPNTGTYFSTDVPPRPIPQTLDEKRAAAQFNEDLNTALAEYGRYFRFFRYAFVGTGAKKYAVDQGGNIGSGGGFAGTVGIDFDGLVWVSPYILEARGVFGFNPPVGETAIYWYLGGPISKALFHDSWNVPNPLNHDLEAGLPFGAAVLKNGPAIPDWAAQYLPVKIELGVGYHGLSFEQPGGTIIDGGSRVRGVTTGMIAGIGFAGRLAYFGERNMLRLTAYRVVSKQAKTGGVFPDTLSGLGGEMEVDATVHAKMLEVKADWYHRRDQRVRHGRWVSGYGISLIGRQINFAEGSTTQARILGATSVTTVFPEQNVTQIELLATLGYMR